MKWGDDVVCIERLLPSAHLQLYVGRKNESVSEVREVTVGSVEPIVDSRVVSSKLAA